MFLEIGKLNGGMGAGKVLVAKEHCLLLQWTRVQFTVTSVAGDLIYWHLYTHTPFINININMIKHNKNIFRKKAGLPTLILF